MRRCLALSLFVIPFVAGCVSAQGAGVINIHIGDATGSVRGTSSAVTTLGMKSVTRDAGSFNNFKKEAEIAKDVIETVILPLFEGKDIKTITVATAHKALALLDGKVSPMVKAMIQVALDGAVASIQFPDNPAANLTEDQRKLIVSVFEGINQGLSAYVSWGGPAARDLNPTANAKLFWKKP